MAACAPGPRKRISPMWLTSKRPTAVRTAMCSAISAGRYSTGISQPPKSTIFAFSARWAALRAVFLSGAGWAERSRSGLEASWVFLFGSCCADTLHDREWMGSSQTQRSASSPPRPPEGTHAQIEEYRHDPGGDQETQVIGAVGATGPDAPHALAAKANTKSRKKAPVISSHRMPPTAAERAAKSLPCRARRPRAAASRSAVRAQPGRRAAAWLSSGRMSQQSALRRSERQPRCARPAIRPATRSPIPSTRPIF